MGAVLYFCYYCETSPDILFHTNQSRMKIHSFSEKRPLLSSINWIFISSLCFTEFILRCLGFASVQNAINSSKE